MPFRIFRPLMAGATLRDRALACLGVLVGLGVTGLVCRLLLHDAPQTNLMLAAPLGASAVLLFAVPASPLAQPWSILGGNTISALVGVMVARLVHDPIVAGAIAVALAVAVMSLCRCLHPPGGAVALTAVIGGPAIAAYGYLFALSPVAVNSLLLVAIGWLLHRFSRHSYPHVAKASPAPVREPRLTREDIDQALSAFGEPLDVAREDLDALIDLASANARRRLAGSGES